MPEMNHLDTLLQVKLLARKDQHLYRSLIINDDRIDFCSNDYLGFVKSGILNDLAETGLSSGSTGSRLISGNSKEAEEAEKAIAKFHEAEAALIFSSGYMANIGLLSCLAGKGDTYIVDALAHASIMDGIRLSYADNYKFKHNDLEDLAKKLKHAKGNIFVVTESVYSMNGDLALLNEIAEICKVYNARMIVDEAHATGVWGERGEGFVNTSLLKERTCAVVHTFGKALGSFGAAITCSLTMKDYLINFARPFIYTTALPPYTYRQIHKAYELLPETDRSHLRALIQHFKDSVQAFPDMKFIDSGTQIQGIIIGDNYKTKVLSDHLYNRGIYAKTILSPTVPEGSERIRICLHSFNTNAQIDLLFQELNNFTL